MNSAIPKHFPNLTLGIPILGFTGAIGSGCSFLSKRFSGIHDYIYVSLSKPIKDEILRLKLTETAKLKQEIGNNLRKLNGDDYLIKMALNHVNEEMPKAKYKGVVVDGIRNSGEIDALRHWPHFYLFSVHAETSMRKKRLVRSHVCADDQEFNELDARDQQENVPYGQQVKKCNYLSDIVLLNDEQFSPDEPIKIKSFINSNIFSKYVVYIESISKNEKQLEHSPSIEESLMTIAYVSSKQSHCLKRKVGAVIATKNGEVITTGYNDVPTGLTPCLQDSELQWCARDIAQQDIGQQFKNCPSCGSEIKIDTTCASCSQRITSFLKKCPNCSDDPCIKVICPKCNIDIFNQFLSGRSPRTGRLLDICRSLHAEENAILNLCRNGNSAGKDSVLYTTTFPCNLCANKIIAAGVKKIVYAEPYITLEAKKALETNGVKLHRFEGVKSSAYFRFYA